MKKPVFENNGIYHIYNRGVEKRDIYLNDKDYYRFIHNLFEFNNKRAARNVYYRQSYEVQLHKIAQSPRKLLVEILAFCLMPNHYHLLLRQKVNNGVVNFMQKLGTGYSNYFNIKYDRVGSLFQGRFKAVPVDTELYLLHLNFYIHTNPLELVFPEWKEKRIISPEKAIKFLENYRWSSFIDYTGVKNFPSVTQRRFLIDYFNSINAGEYKKVIGEWLGDFDVDKIRDILLEK